MQAAWRRGPGRLIAFEGIDGSGKSTLSRLLVRWLQAQGVAVAQTSWNSAPLVAPAIRRGKDGRSLVPLTFSLAHACDFADRLERTILPHLEAGHIVVADRYAFTGIARDSARGLDPGWMRDLYGFAPLPHLTFYCEIAPEVAVKRLLEGRQRIKYYEAGLDVDPGARDRRQAFVRFQGRVAAAYGVMAEEFGFTRLDATLSLTEQQRVVREAVAAVVEGLDGMQGGEGTSGGGRGGRAVPSGDGPDSPSAARADREAAGRSAGADREAAGREAAGHEAAGRGAGAGVGNGIGNGNGGRGATGAGGQGGWA